MASGIAKVDSRLDLYNSLCTRGIPSDPGIGSSATTSWCLGASAGTPSVGLCHKGQFDFDKVGQLSMSHFTEFSTALPLSAVSDTSAIVLTGIIAARRLSQRLDAALRTRI